MRFQGATLMKNHKLLIYLSEKDKDDTTSFFYELSVGDGNGNVSFMWMKF